MDAEENEPPEGMVAPNLVIARAGGPHGDSSVVQARMQVGDVTDETLSEVLEAVSKLYRESFGEDPAREGVAVLPWFNEEDDPDAS